MKNTIRKRKLNSRGFTLVEMIAVGVLLAIAAGIAMPSFAGYVDLEKNNSAITQCKQCVLAAQSLCVERYAAGLEFPLEGNQAEIMENAGVHDGELKLMLLTSPKAVSVAKLVFQAASGVVVTYRDHNYYLGEIASFADRDTAAAVVSAFAGIVTGNKNLDSKALEFETSNSTAAHDLLLDSNMDLEAMGAVSWQWKRNDNGEYFYWTPVDIAGLASGTQLPVMRFNKTTGTYTVWIATIKPKTENFKDADGKLFSATYNWMSGYKGYANSTDDRPSSEVQTYDDMMHWYNEALTKSYYYPNKTW